MENISEEQKALIIAEYKQKKAEAKAKEKEAWLKHKAFEESLTPEEKAKVAERVKEIKAAEAKAAKEKAENEKTAKLAEKLKIKAMSADEKKAYLDEKKKQKKIADDKAIEEMLKNKEVKAAKKLKDLENRYDSGAAVSRFFLNLSQTKFIRFFKDGWDKFAIRHPLLSAKLWQFFVYWVFCMGVTIWQLLVMLFLPYAFTNLSEISFVWPQIQLWEWSTTVATDNYATHMIWGIFNEPAVLVDANNPSLGYVATGGLANFVALEIATFTAQIINFPLQRNITYKSHGNIPFQILWYFIGWVGVSIGVNAVWGFINPILLHLVGKNFLFEFLKTFVTGGVSMIIFYFVFLVIFPEGAADTSKAQAEKELFPKRYC